MLNFNVDPLLSDTFQWFLIGLSLSLTIISVTTLWFHKKSSARHYLALKQSQRSLEFALQSGRMGTWDIDLKTDKISCSEEMLYIWGISPESFHGQRSTLQSKVHPDDVDRMRNIIEKAIESETVYEMQYRIIPFPGMVRWVLARGRCTFLPNSRKPIRFSGVVYDISEKKAKEEELAEAVKIRDQFFMMASHELRTPLTCMQLQLQVAEWDLKHRFPESFTYERIESNIRKQTQHLSRITRLVDHILDESKISQGRLMMLFEQIDLNEMVADLIEQYRVTAESSGVKVNFTKTEKVIGMWDRFRLEQVFLNLLINGIRYGKKNPIEIQVKTETGKALLVFKDEGIGIKPEDQARIFERFERASSEHENDGMGLGLYIANRIVIAHGGEMRLKSEFGKGSEFTVVLPLQ